MPSLSPPIVTDALRNEVSRLSDDGRISLSDVKSDKELTAAYRDLAKRSLYFFTKGVLQYKDLTKKTHLPICRFIQEGVTLPGSNSLMFLPRGTFKTTIGSIATPIWVQVNDPNQSMFIANQTLDNSERFVLEQEMHLDGHNAMMCWLFPEYIKPNDKFKPWASDRYSTPAKTSLRGQPNVTALGVGTRSESKHMGIGFFDDLVGVEDMMSESNMAAAAIWYQYAQSLGINPRDFIRFVIGTRWPGDAPLYGKMIKSGAYRVFHRPAQNLTGKVYEGMQPNELFFPEWLDEEVLRKIRDENYIRFMFNYMNEETGIGASDFQQHWLKYFWLVKHENEYVCQVDEEYFSIRDGDVVIALDPAGSGDLDASNISDIKLQGSMKRANNAISIWLAHKSGRYFQLESWAGRAVGENPELQIAKKLLEFVVAYQTYLRDGYVEAYGAQAAIITIFNMLAQEQGVTFKLKETPRGLKTAKDVRIRSTLGPIAENGQMYVRRSQDQFIYEFGMFPQKNVLRDTLDSATWAISNLRMPTTRLGQAIASRVTVARRNKRMKYLGGSRTGY